MSAKDLRLLNAVLLAEDYERLRDWWIDVVGLTLMQEWTEDYHYAELGCEGHLVIGVADAKEMKAAPPSPRANAVVAQLRVADVAAFLEQVRTGGGTIEFGPSYEEGEGFWYGAFRDGEGNSVWVVSMPGYSSPAASP